MYPRPERIAVSLALILGALLAMAGSAAATVTFDPATGTGYVDKTDVQAAFGWKDQTFQANAKKVRFHGVHVTSWTWDCLIGGESVTFVGDVQSSRAVELEALGTAVGRTVRAVTGFDLNGFAGGTSPAPGSDPTSCPSGDPANVSSGSSDVLYADFRGQSEPIWSD